MATVFRVEKNSNYTTLSNYHFKDKRLSWKAKGLLSTMLSLPDDWDYTIEGLAKLSDDGVKATNSGLIELEKYGYLVREQSRGEKGHFGTTCYTIYEQPVEQKEDPVVEQTEPQNDYVCQPICQNGQTAQSIENTAFSPLGRKRQTDKRLTEKGGQLNTNILNTKELNTNSSSSSSDDVQKSMRKNLILDEETEYSLRKRFEIEHIAKKCSHELVEAVFKQLCQRDAEFVRVMNARALEQVCLSIKDKQKKEPIRILPNLINKYLDNIMLGIKAAGGGGPTTIRGQNAFNNFQQNHYDFDALEKEIISN